MYTEVITYAEAMTTARELTTQGNRWTVSANRYYQMTPPTQDARLGMIELIGPMEIICDWDYDNLKLAIEGDTNRAITVTNRAQISPSGPSYISGTWTEKI